jgi:hypothetical protein
MPRANTLTLPFPYQPAFSQRSAFCSHSTTSQSPYHTIITPDQNFDKEKENWIFGISIAFPGVGVEALEKNGYKVHRFFILCKIILFFLLWGSFSFILLHLFCRRCVRGVI